MWETGKILGGEKQKRRQEGVGSVAAYPSNPENSKEAEREVLGIKALTKDFISRECFSSLSRLIRGFRDKYLYSPLGEQIRMV